MVSGITYAIHFGVRKLKAFADSELMVIKTCATFNKLCY